ncbi:MAG: nitrogenase iron-molybdenum cofactor biosynthesis protein NifE [Spirochaetales bacterium]|nr:nitrogenase iron-molybdenum cofactor biosynthesis protein NifE [Spirochaetales bacterium]
MTTAVPLLKEREKQVYEKGKGQFEFQCERKSVAGSVSQRACVFCGSRVVLYPVADALHLAHGSIGCASYTWDIRGSVSSGPELHRLCFSTDLREKDVIHGGEKKLMQALRELIPLHKPRAAFVYSTCIVGVIGDDVQAVCRKATEELGIPVIPVQSEGFNGTKKDGYRVACKALTTLVGTDDTTPVSKISINILGEFNLAGEAWIIKEYYRRMGVEVVSILTGDGRVDHIRKSHRAALNVVQCSGSLTYLAEEMKEKYGIPFMRVSYFGIEDVSKALYDVAGFFEEEDPAVMGKAAALVREEVAKLQAPMKTYRSKLAGKKAAIYVGGAFKAFSLIKILRTLSVDVVMVGSQTGNKQDYAQLADMCDPGTVIVDDSNPMEMSRFIIEKDVDLFIGGVKERPMAFKLGVGFCDHNHERKTALAGFEGTLNFAEEVASSALSPVWRFSPRRSDSGKRS